MNYANKTLIISNRNFYDARLKGWFENENIPISKAMNIISDLDTEKRKDLQLKINDKLKEISFFAEAEINAIFNYKKINDEMRGFKNHIVKQL